MEAKTVEPEIEKETEKRESIESAKSEIEATEEEPLDEPILDDTTIEEKPPEDFYGCAVEKGEDVNRNDTNNEKADVQMEKSDDMVCVNNEDEQKDDESKDETQSETKLQTKQEEDKTEEKVLSDRQLRNSVKIDKPLDQDKAKDSNDKKPEEKQSETPKERKRRYKNFSSSPVKTTPDEITVKSKRKRLQSDKFCWRCHKESVEMHCSACPRSWHRKCIGGQPSDSIENWICGECAAILKAENVESRSVTMAHVTVDQLCMMLKHVVERMRDYPGSEPFWKAVDVNDVTNYLDYVVKPMDLSLLESNVRSKLYGSTDAFMADAKWIQHNCIVFNTCGGVYADTLKLTNAAKQMIKVARQEVSEMEACPDCYAHGRNLPRPMQSWFIEPCQRPHTLVWAKLKGFPFWPAKAMPRVNGQGFVDVRFFGAHDRAWVSPKDMYLYSREPPTSFPRKRKQDLDDCVKEIERHCQKLAMVFGEFTFAPPKVQYNPQDCDQIKLLLPHYDPSQPASKLMGAAMRKRSIANKKGTPAKKKSEEDDEQQNNKSDVKDENKDDDLMMAPEVKKAKLDTSKSSNDDKSSSSDSGATTPVSDKDKSNNSPALKRRNGFFGDKSTSTGEIKANHHPKKLSAILPSRISKRRTSSAKTTPDKTSKLLNKVDSPEASKKISLLSTSSSKTVPPITIVKSPLKKNEATSLLNKTATTNVGVAAKQQKSLLFFVVNNDKNAMKRVASSSPNKISISTTSLTTTTATTTTSTNIKQEPRSAMNSSSSSPVPEENRKEARARKSFANKVPSFPQQDRIPPLDSRHTSYPSSPMVIIPNYQTDGSRITSSYQIPPAEAGPLSANLNKGAQELARRMAQLIEESLKDIAQNNLEMYENSSDSYRASIHMLQLKIEKLKWQHQEEITEMQHNYERNLKEMRSSLEAEMQRMLEETQKLAEEQRRKSIEETKKKQWCALCGKEANFYCCWNTSYCNYPCQEAHWSVHMSSCTQQAYETIAPNNAQQQQMLPKLKNVISSA